MRSARTIFFTILLPGLAVLAMLPGCDGGALTSKPKKRPSETGPEEDVAKVAVAVKEYGKITGKVIYDGEPPPQAPLPIGAAHQACCIPRDPKFNDEGFYQEWVVDKATKGVKNAVVILQPPAGKFFDVPAEQQKNAGDVVVDQPYCAFRPHVFVHVPSYYDKTSATQKESGQKLIIKNGASCEHNFSFDPKSDENRAIGKTLGAGQDFTFPTLNPQGRNGVISCNIHNWMRCYGFILDHPYWAITKEDGTFVIENAPLGVDLQVVAWHEMPGFFNGGEDGKTMKLQVNQDLALPKIKSR